MPPTNRPFIIDSRADYYPSGSNVYNPRVLDFGLSNLTVTVEVTTNAVVHDSEHDGSGFGGSTLIQCDAIYIPNWQGQTFGKVIEHQRITTVVYWKTLEGMWDGKRFKLTRTTELSRKVEVQKLKEEWGEWGLKL